MKNIIMLILAFFNFNIIYSQPYYLNVYDVQNGTLGNQIQYYNTSTASLGNTNSSSGILIDNFSSDFTSRDFFPLDIVNDPNAYPWRTSVKFNDASGFLIDPYFMITAGHNIDFQSGYWETLPIFAGYDAGSNWSDQPYQYAYAEYFYRPVDFSSNSGTDFAIIKLDRPIGALVGWNGFGYNNDDAFFTEQNNVFYNPGFPNQYPFNSNFLFNWKGFLDNAQTESIWSYRDGYTGFSGSPAYTILNNNFIAYGILTTTGIKFNRITPYKFDAINKAISLHTPSQLDLIPLWTKVSPRYITSGNALQKINFVLHNYSSQAVRFSNITVNVYLSTDNIITASDELLTTFNYTDGFSAKGSVFKEETVSLPVINKPAGDYYIGLMISGDNSLINNNTTKSLDVAKITVSSQNYVTMKGTVSSLYSNNGLCNFVLDGFPYPTRTDFKGYYETQVPYGWSGSFTPYKDGDHNFQVMWYSNVTQTVTNKFQAAKEKLTISGYVYDIDDTPLPGVLMKGFPGNNYTDDKGYYSVNVYYNWSGVIRPTFSNFFFTPHYHSNMTTSEQLNYIRTSDENEDNKFVTINIPKEFKLSQNYPNPFNPVTNIKYNIPKDVMVSIKVYDITGREISKLVNEYKKAGYYNVTFNGGNLASGIYYYRIQAGDFVQIKKMVLIK